MKFNNIKEIIKGTIGIIIISMLGIGFFLVISLNKAVETEVEQGNEYISIVEKSVLNEIDQRREELGEFSKIYAINSLNKVISTNDNSFEVMGKIFIDQAERFFISDKSVKHVSMEIRSDGETKQISWKSDKTLTYIQDIKWEDESTNFNSSSYKFKLVEKGYDSLFVIKIPIMFNDTYQDSSLIMAVDLDEILFRYWQENGLRINLIDKNKNVYIYDKFDYLEKHLKDLLLKTSSDNEYFSLANSSHDNNVLSYNHGEIFLFKQISEDYYLTFIKPYQKLSLRNIQDSMFSHILVYILMGIGIIGFIIISHEKTKKWIEKDRVFLNEIIDLDKIQISELRKELKFYKKSVEDGPFPTLFIDKHSLGIINANKEAVLFYGYSEEELLNLQLTDICQWEDSVTDDEVLEIIHLKANDVNEQGHIRLQEIAFNDNDMLVVIVELNHTVAIGDTEGLKLEMFHEIRSPLQGAFGAVDLIDQASDAYSDYTNIIKRSLNSVLMMTENVLSQGKLQSPYEKVSLEEFNLVELIYEVKQLTIYQDKNFNEVTASVNEKMGKGWHRLDEYHINGDRSKIKQILINLASNASKYTRDGHIEILAEVTRHSPEDKVIFKVIDNGNGISKTAQEDIYTSFKTFHDSSQVSSTGIGLFVSKKYVELLGGVLEIKSVLNEGSTFSFALALESRNKKEILKTNEYSILILDDDSISCSFLKHLLEKELSSYVKTIVDEGQILSELSHRSYDLLLIDENLNHFMGHDIIDLIKKSLNQRLVNLPIVLMSASPQKSRDEYHTVLKPFENTEIVSLVKNLLTKQVLLPYLDLDLINHKVFCETYESVGQEIFFTLLDKFLITSAQDLEIIDDLLEKEKYEKATETFHKLKGSMSYFGSKICQSLIAELETMSKDEDVRLFERYINFKREFSKFITAIKIVHEKLNA